MKFIHLFYQTNFTIQFDIAKPCPCDDVKCGSTKNVGTATCGAGNKRELFERIITLGQPGAKAADNAFPFIVIMIF